jgi:hypothetical protein
MASEPGPSKPEEAISAASVLFAYRVLKALVDKGLLTQAEAANVMTETANDIRSLTEDGTGAAFGEYAARRYEQLAAWLLGRRENMT